MTLATEIHREVEIIPGACRRLIDLTIDDLDAARAVARHKAELRNEAEVLIGRAAEGDVELPDELRERVACWAGLLPDLTVLVSELRQWVVR